MSPKTTCFEQVPSTCSDHLGLSLALHKIPHMSANIAQGPLEWRPNPPSAIILLNNKLRAHTCLQTELETRHCLPARQLEMQPSHIAQWAQENRCPAQMGWRHE